MPAVANITLNDAQATPALHTFIPVGPDQTGTWWFEDQSVSSPIGYNRISVQLVRPKNPAPGESSGTRVSRVKIGIHTPILETLGNNSAGIVPPPQVGYIPRCMIEFILPDRSALLDRQTLRKYADFLLANAQITSVIETLQNIY